MNLHHNLLRHQTTTIPEVEEGLKDVSIETMLAGVLVGEDEAVEEEVKGVEEATIETRERKMELLLVEAGRAAQCHHQMVITKI